MNRKTQIRTEQDLLLQVMVELGGSSLRESSSAKPCPNSNVTQPGHDK
ncbi:MAG TPA: hypothetical protein VKY92_22180 [Verrucomicrobiae bacterium]|nr:hypothetical protein [Verrucomicrobiae bacterium]